MEAPEEVILDVNEIARDRKFTQLGAMDVSPDGSSSPTPWTLVGFRQYALQVREIATGRLLPDAASA
jgi:oligopeptidase B